MNTDNKNKTLPISSLLNDDHCSVAALYKKAISIQEIDRNLKKLLDQSLKDKFELANINADAAILLVSSSAWATRLRYNIPAILNAFNKQLNLTSIKTIRIKIKKSLPENSAVIKKPIYLSNYSAQFLNDVADSFSDPELRNCFLNISKNHLK
ncbi:MAG: hypothetical protein DHS20C09_03440 [marine bacterium B5-7]|nr:MAG: hypothetical protein DHS20C09_03440 [marine bacterium B5-7]